MSNDINRYSSANVSPQMASFEELALRYPDEYAVAALFPKAYFSMEKHWPAKPVAYRVLTISDKSVFQTDYSLLEKAHATSVMNSWVRQMVQFSPELLTATETMTKQDIIESISNHNQDSSDRPLVVLGLQKTEKGGHELLLAASKMIGRALTPETVTPDVVGRSFRRKSRREPETVDQITSMSLAAGAVLLVNNL